MYSSYSQQICAYLKILKREYHPTRRAFPNGSSPVNPYAVLISGEHKSNACASHAKTDPHSAKFSHTTTMVRWKRKVWQRSGTKVYSQWQISHLAALSLFPVARRQRSRHARCTYLTWGICTRRASKLYKARSRLYRSQILQVNTRWKALSESYTMHSFAQLYNLKFLSTFR